MIEWLIIDGHNLLHRDLDRAGITPMDWGTARTLLLRRIEQVASEFARKTTIVFDGRDATGSESFESDILDILYSPGHLTADTVIERMVHDCRNPSRILVVTSDRAERETVDAAGADTMSCGVFLEHCQNMDRKSAQTLKRNRHRQKDGFNLGDAFPF